MQRAVETLDHFPSIAQVEAIASELGETLNSGWKYLESPDCLRCGGPGWHWALDLEGRRGPVACDSCRAGKNLQRGPNGTLTRTLKQSGGHYDEPGQSIPDTQTEESSAA
jgi:hypothetical protein